MRIYLAADLNRKEEMKGCRHVLEILGHKVTSRWIDTAGPEEGVGVGGPPLSEDNTAYYSQYAVLDEEDIRAADTLILFTTGELSRGGRHTELGIGKALGKHIIIVGPREHVFHCVKEVQHFPEWSDLVLYLSSAHFS